MKGATFIFNDDFGRYRTAI